MKTLVFCLLTFITSVLNISLGAIPTATLDDRLVADLRMLANGSFYPLTTFMSEEDYLSVLSSMHLKNGALFPLPIVLPVDAQIAEGALREKQLVLKDERNTPLAICKVTAIYDPDLERECLDTLGTLDENHPFVSIILSRKGKKYVTGILDPSPSLSLMDRSEGVATPDEIKSQLASHLLEKKPVLAFQTRNPLHGTHLALILHALKTLPQEAHLLLHPVIGPTQDEDVPVYIRKRCYQAVLNHFQPYPVTLSYLPLSMRMAGPKETLLHALIRKNYGASHFIVGKDQAGPSTRKKTGEPFYAPTAAAELASEYAPELGIEILAIPDVFYFIEELGRFLPESALQPGMTKGTVSGSELRRKLKQAEPLPDWFSTKEVLDILGSYYRKKGFCIYLTGLSGAGKTTLASALKEKLESLDPHLREVVLLDGDLVRKQLSSGLGYSKQDRSLNVQRIGFVSSLIVGSGGIVICANIAPYEEDRCLNRKWISAKGDYIEVFVDTPLDVCERRDEKGLYQMARQGLLSDFVGISSPYERPSHPDLVISNEGDLEPLTEQILQTLRERNLIP